MRSIRLVRLAGTGLAGLIAALAIAAPASAATCAGKSSQPFSPWGDFNFYEPAPNGTLESTNGWTLTGGRWCGAGPARAHWPDSPRPPPTTSPGSLW